MRRVRWLLVAPLVLAVAFTCTITAQHRLDRLRSNQFDEELLYLPNEKLLNHFTSGLDSVVADLLWLKCITYTTQHFKGDRKFEWLGHMCDTITRLDPHFVDVYRCGGIFLAAMKADDDASIELMKSGIVRNPESWELPYEIAMVYLLNRRDDPGSAELAAYYLNMSVTTGRAPQSVLNFANNLQAKHDLVEVERAMWSELLKGEDKFMRDLAERKLMELTLRENCKTLTKAVDAYAEKTGGSPADLQALVASGIIHEIPPDPLGGTYFIDKDGEVQNTTVLDQKRETWLNRLSSARDRFKEKEGRLPSSIEEMRDKEYLPFVPKYPYKDRTWQYDPETGTIQ